MNKAMVLLAEGCEEMEATIIIDVLRRADWRVDAVGFSAEVVRCSRGVCIEPDLAWDDVDLASYDVMVLPGGTEGMENLRRESRVLEALGQHSSQGKILGAICAAPLVLQEAGLIDGRAVTCHPGIAEMLTATTRRTERVVVDGNIVTSQGPGTAMEFALKLIELVDGKEKAESIGKGLVL